MELHCQVLDVMLPCSYVRCHHREVGEGARDLPVPFTATSCKAIIILKSSLKKKTALAKAALARYTVLFSKSTWGSSEARAHRDRTWFLPSLWGPGPLLTPCGEHVG